MPRTTLSNLALSGLIPALLLTTGCRSSDEAPQGAEKSVAAETVPEFEVIALEFAVADELANVLQALVDDASSGDPTAPKILVDPRTNSLLVMATPDRMPEIKNLVARLDVEATTGG